MQMEIIIQGLTLGLAYAAPIGIQNMYVINAALKMPKRQALICGATVAFYDITLALACFFGIGSIITHTQAAKTIIMCLGGALLIYMGAKIIVGDPAKKPGQIFTGKMTSMYWTAFVLTWFNPQALIDGSMILGAIYASLLPEQLNSFIFGMSSASLIWFMSLATIVSMCRNFFTPSLLKCINFICGIIIIIFGLKLIFEMF